MVEVDFSAAAKMTSVGRPDAMEYGRIRNGRVIL